jgi:hypothetical protein
MPDGPRLNRNSGRGCAGCALAAESLHNLESALLPGLVSRPSNSHFTCPKVPKD